jgi:hypothetical protein
MRTSRYGLAVASFVAPLALSAMVACSKKGNEAPDAAPPAPSVAAVDAGPPPMPEPANDKSVARFGDEAALAQVKAQIADARATARTSVPGGTVVATLARNTAVTEIAQHEKWILAVFADPKNPSRTLEGWIGEESFKAGPTPPPPKGSGCPGKQVHLTSDEVIFCGQVCKADGDCPKHQECSGSAHLLVDGGEGDPVQTCTMPPKGGGKGGDAGGGAAPSPSPSPTPAPTPTPGDSE